MGTINQIKSKLLELEGGSFQRLCDDWLYRKGYKNINAIGMMQMTDRVVKGTPDSLVIQPDGKYVFSEYTVQQDDLAKKLKDDIDKCFNEKKTGISCEKISEIIICYLGRLTTHEISHLKGICEDKGVKINLNGLDSISLSIQNCYPVLSEKYLGLPLDSGQLLSVDYFIIRYGKNGFTTTIDNEILFQDDALNQGIEHLEKGNFLLVSGPVGVGKTLFSVNLSKMVESKYPEMKVYCVFDKGADLHRDITAYFSEPGEYLLFVDDANRLDNRLDYILHYLNEHDEKRTFKIIATVRDYARDSVVQKVSNYTYLNEQAINPLTDEQINELIVNLFDIKNSEYQQRIQEIAGGNPRLAIMASRIALRTKQVESIKNVTSLYDDYFGQNESVKEVVENEKLIVTACAISFFRKIDKLNNFHMSFVQNVFGIQAEEFWEYVTILHNNELVDLYEDEVVKISDQVLSTYLFYLAVFEKERISFSLIVNNFYPDFKRKIVDALNPVISAFDHKIIVSKIRSQILAIFEVVSSTKTEIDALEFLNSFWFALPTESLIFAKNMIYNAPEVDIDWTTETFKESKNEISEVSLVRLLCNFRYFSESELKISCDLMLKYLEKSKDSLGYVIRALTDNYNFKSNDWRFGYATQKLVVDKLSERMDGGSNYLFTRLFILAAKCLLKVEYREHQSTRGNAISIITFRLTPDEHLLPIRESLFIGLSGLIGNCEYKQLIYETLREYVNHLRFDGKEMVVADFPLIKNYIVAVLDKSKLSHCLLMEKLCEHLEALDIDFPEQWKSDFTNSSLQLSNLLLENRNERRMLEMGYEEYSQYRHQCLVEYFSELSLDAFRLFIEQCHALQDSLTGRERDYLLKTGIDMSLSAIADAHPNIFSDVISIYLDYDDLFELNPKSIISNLFKTVPPTEVWNLINSKDYRWKKWWRSFYFSQLPEAEISTNSAVLLLEYISDTPSNELLPDGIEFLTKYQVVDDDIFSKVARILVSRSVEDENYARPLGSLYNEHSNLFGLWFDVFKSDKELAFDAYLAAFKIDKYFDCSGEALDLLTAQNKDFLFRLIDEVYEEESWPSLYTNMPELDFLWQRDSFIEDVERYAIYVYRKEKDSYRTHDNIFKKLFTKEKGKPESEELTLKKGNFIKHTISKNISDINYVCFIFAAAIFMDEEFRRELLSSFLDLNCSFEDFQKIEYELRTTSCSGSRVPILEREKNYLISILPLLNSVDLLEHRAYVEKQIECKIKNIESEKKRDFLESR
jgi:DNA polymerase III delta prime subunit